MLDGTGARLSVLAALPVTSASGDGIMDESRGYKSRVLAWPGLVLVVSACASMGPSPGRVTVKSDPPGADVYVMGQKRGTTPAEIPQDAVFPPSYRKEQAALYGKIELRMPGCETFVQAVTRESLAKGILARLSCGAVPGGPGTVRNPATPVEPQGKTAEERLRHIKELRDRGLITEEEASEARRRILSGL